MFTNVTASGDRIPNRDPGIQLSAGERGRALLLSYRVAVDRLPDLEVGWERDRWRELAVPTLAGICDTILRERAAHDCAIPAASTVAGLDALWRRAHRSRAVARVGELGTSLLDAVRLDYWLERSGGGS